jgi:hypothetical protein
MSATFEHGYALIIGVNDNMIPSLALPAVAKDVTALQEVLLHPQRCGYQPDNVRLLLGEASTRDNILAAFDWLQDKVNGDVEATAVIYYSGHGMLDPVANRYYLIPYDMDLPDEDDDDLYGSAITGETLAAKISAITPKRKLTILDCCHSAGMDVKRVDMATLGVTAGMKSVAFPELPEVEDVPVLDAQPGAKAANLQLRRGEGRAVLNSSTGAQSSYVRPDQKMSIFTYHLIEALTGHASLPDAEVVNVADVMSWVTNKVEQSAGALKLAQTPVMRTTGVFPVALVIGGQGIAKGMAGTLPDPLQPLPPVAAINQQGHVNIAGDARLGQIGDKKVVKKKKVDKSKKVGVQVKGDVGGDVAGRDMTKQEGGVRFKGTMSGGTIVGRDQHVVQQGSSDKEELAALFIPLLQEVRQQNEAAAAQVKELQAEIARGEQADDEKMSDLIMDIAEAAPAVVETLVGLFTNSIVAKAAGAGAKATLRFIQRRR